MNLEKISAKVIEIAKNSGEFIRSQRNAIKEVDIQSKGLNDFVTYVDKTSEKMIVNELSKLIHDSGFITEEKTIETQRKSFNWIIDPLDGTTNYIHGAAPFAVSIALQYENEIVLGVVYEISLDECFYSCKNEPAFLNEKVITVSNISSVSNALIATGFPYHDFHLMKEYSGLLEYFMRNSHGLRRLGSAATDLVYCACGRYDGFFEYGLNSWDVAAGAFILEQANGKICDFDFRHNWLFGKEIIASNSLIFNEFSIIINNFLSKKKDLDYSRSFN